MTKRKTLLVDLDNVVYPFTEMMATIIASNTEINNSPQELMALLKSWNIWEDWGIPKGVFDWWWEKAVQEGVMWRQGHPIEGAVTALWRLSDAEWHIHLVTTRLNKFRLHDQAAINTVEWLRACGIPYRSLSFTEDKHLVHGDAIVDDNPSNLIGHPAPTRILFPAHHNRDWEQTGWEAQDYGIIELTDDPDLVAWNEIVDILGSGKVGE